MGLSLGGLLAPITGGASLIPGAPELAGDMLTGGAISNARSVEATNAQNFQESQRNRDFQERMSNSAYQRAIEDMRKAGLNPALAYQNGGASTPSGSTATATAPRKGDIGAGLFNTAKAIATEGASFQNTNSQTELNKAQTEVANINTQKIGASAKETETNERVLAQKEQTERHNTRIAKAEAKLRENEIPASDAMSQFNAKTAPIKGVGELLKQFIGIGSSAKDLLSPGFDIPKSNPTTRQLQRAGSKGVKLP